MVGGPAWENWLAGVALLAFCALVARTVWRTVDSYRSWRSADG
jgi:hypothetical protein